MPGLSSADIISKVPSLAQTLLCAANPEETPFITRCPKGEEVTQMQHSYFVRVKPARRTGGATDGQDVQNYEGDGARKQLDIRIQEFRRTPKVGQQSQAVVKDSTIKDQFAFLKLQLGMEILKDAEAIIMSDTVGAADEGLDDRGSRGAGVFDRLRDSTFTQTDLPIPVEVRIPTNQILTGALASAVTETTLTDAMEARRNACGSTPSLVAFVGTKWQRKFDEFENYFPNSTAGSQTTVMQVLKNMEVEKTVKRGIRYYEGSFGTVEVVIDDFIVNNTRMGLFDMTQMKILPFGKMVTFTDLPNTGGGPRGLLAATMGWKVGDPRAHIVGRNS